MQPAKKVLGGRKKVRVAVVQTPPIFLDKEKTIDRACQKIGVAANNGAELIVFTESWIPGYPYWSEHWDSEVKRWASVRAQYYDNAIIIPSEDTDRLCAAAAEAKTHLVVGCTEVDGRPGVHTLYNSLLFIDRSGKVLGRRRKVMPTFVERAVWGWGDGTDLVSFDTDIGRIGGLICGEHLMTLIRARMIQQGEDFHIAVFPGAFSLHTGPRLQEADTEGQYFWGYASTKAHALEAGAFVLCACGYITRNDIPSDFALADKINVDWACGGSTIISPLGIPLVPPTFGDTIIYADCEADMIKAWKAIIDSSGHYSRPDIVSLEYKSRS